MSKLSIRARAPVHPYPPFTNSPADLWTTSTATLSSNRSCSRPRRRRRSRSGSRDCAGTKDARYSTVPLLVAIVPLATIDATIAIRSRSRTHTLSQRIEINGSCSNVNGTFSYKIWMVQVRQHSCKPNNHTRQSHLTTTPDNHTRQSRQSHAHRHRLIDHAVHPQKEVEADRLAHHAKATNVRALCDIRAQVWLFGWTWRLCWGLAWSWTSFGVTQDLVGDTR